MEGDEIGVENNAVKFVLNNIKDRAVLTGYTSAEISCSAGQARIGLYGTDLIRSFLTQPGKSCKFGIPAQPPGTVVEIRYDFWNNQGQPGQPGVVTCTAPGRTTMDVCTIV